MERWWDMDCVRLRDIEAEHAAERAAAGSVRVGMGVFKIEGSVLHALARNTLPS